MSVQQKLPASISAHVVGGLALIERHQGEPALERLQAVKLHLGDGQGDERLVTNSHPAWEQLEALVHDRWCRSGVLVELAEDRVVGFEALPEGVEAPQPARIMTWQPSEGLRGAGWANLTLEFRALVRGTCDVQNGDLVPLFDALWARGR